MDSAAAARMRNNTGAGASQDSISRQADSDLAVPLVALSADGGYAAIAAGKELVRLDVTTNRRELLHEGITTAVEFAGDQLWAIADNRLLCLGSDEHKEWPCEARKLFVDGETVAFQTDANGAVSSLVRLEADGDRLDVTLDQHRGAVVGFASHGLFGVTSPGRLSIVDLGGRLRAEILVGAMAVRSIHPVFSGRFAVCWMSAKHGDELWVLEPRGALVHRLELPPLRAVAVAGGPGTAVALDSDNQLQLVCLRTGTVRDVAPSPLETTRAIATSVNGGALVLAGAETGDETRLLHLGYGGAFHTPTASTPPSRPAANAAFATRDLAPVVVAPAPALALTTDSVASLAAPGGRSTLSELDRAALIDAEVRWWKTQVGKEIARQWKCGSLATRHHDRVPFESEVLALLDAVVESPASAEPIEAIDRQGDQARESRALAVAQFDGVLTPIGELAARFALSEAETELLMAAAAPALDAETRRLYAIASGAEGWATETLLRRIVGHGSLRKLVAEGLLIRRNQDSPGVALQPTEAVLSLLREPPTLPADPTDLGPLFIPETTLARIVEALESRRPRLALRAARGRGRVTLARHLASLAGNVLDVIEDDDNMQEALAAARVHGHVPFVHIAGDSPNRALLENYLGVLIACVPANAGSPFERAAPVVDLPPISDRERRDMWLALLPDEDPSTALDLAARFHVPPAIALDTVDRVGANARAITSALSGSLGEELRSLAEPVPHLATWSEVILDDSLAASIRELVNRRRHFDRVCFEWGMDAAMRSARGLVALFSGPPGTGKTLAAGLVARELDRELYRIDLSRVMSKWIGETEKKLATLFDAAEQADAVILFDEADSLFSKRTSVKSSNDRHSNLEVNYILQRLDTFRGVAVLTTNQSSSIDPAFRRRLTAQLHFPLPDETTRERLWRAHLPKRAPIASGLDLASLAKSYPLTGGQIRNMAIRATFLAASLDEELSQSHYQRAIELEYQERGKLSASGRLV